VSDALSEFDAIRIFRHDDFQSDLPGIFRNNLPSRAPMADAALSWSAGFACLVYLAFCDLYAQCVRLRRQGFAQVRVLHGGIAQWHARGFPIQGRAPSLAAQIRLSATELWQETHNPRNLMLLDASLSALAQAIPMARTIPSPTPETIGKALGTHSRRNADGAAVVLATALRLDDARLTELARAARPFPFLIYDGSADDYRRQIELQRAVWKAHEQGPRSPRCGG
jgi:hypothetical protein